MYFKGEATANRNPVNVSFRCANCGQTGTFNPLGQANDVNGHFNEVHNHFAGIRKCPNPKCHAVAFVISNSEGTVHTYPPEILEFDATNIPPAIKETFEEAILCYAHACYRATAIMVRRTMEMLCEERGASGKNLKDRLESLRGKLGVPKELFDAAHQLRLLGNDAAHTEAQVYNEIGKNELEVGLELAKELMKATYQYAALVDRLKKLQQPQPKQ